MLESFIFRKTKRDKDGDFEWEYFENPNQDNFENKRHIRLAVGNLGQLADAILQVPNSSP